MSGGSEIGDCAPFQILVKKLEYLSISLLSPTSALICTLHTRLGVKLQILALKQSILTSLRACLFHSLCHVFRDPLAPEKLCHLMLASKPALLMTGGQQVRNLSSNTKARRDLKDARHHQSENVK